MASTPAKPGLKEEQDLDFPETLTPLAALSKLCDMDIDVFPVDDDEDDDYCHFDEVDVDELTPEVGFKFSPIPLSQKVAGPARDPLMPSRKDNLSSIKREMKNDDSSVTFTRDRSSNEKKSQSRSLNPYTCMRMPLYMLNPEDYPEDLEMQRKIRRAKFTWRHHLRLKKLTLLLSNEIILLRQQNNSLKGKVLELGLCGCPINVGKGLDLLDEEVPKLTGDHVELEEILERLRKEEATIMAVDTSFADKTTISTTTTGENNEAQTPSLENLAKEVKMEVEDCISLHGQKAKLKSQRDQNQYQNQSETMKMKTLKTYQNKRKNLGIRTSSTTTTSQDRDQERASMKSQMLKNLGLCPTTKISSVEIPSSSHNFQFLNQRRFPTPANRIYIPYKKIDIETMNQPQTPATSLPISKLYFDQLKNPVPNASVPVTVTIPPSGSMSGSAPREQNLGHRHSHPPRRFISGPASSTIIEKEKDLSAGMNSATITTATTTSSQNTEEMSKKKQINEKFVWIRGKWFKVVKYADFLRDKLDKKGAEGKES